MKKENVVDMDVNEKNSGIWKVREYCATIKKDLEILDTKFTHAENKEIKDALLKELTMKRDEGKAISKEIDQTKDNIDYDFTIEPKDIVLTTTDGKRISLMDELKIFTKETDMSVGFFTENTYAYYDNIGHMYPNAYREKLLDREVGDEYVFPEHIIITPSFWNIWCKPLALYRMAHELWHAVDYQKTHTWNMFRWVRRYTRYIKEKLWRDMYDENYKNIIEKERNAHAWALKFITYIERKYNINTHALDEKYYKIALAFSQMKYLVNKHFPGRSGVSKTTIAKQKAAESYRNKRGRKFL